MKTKAICTVGPTSESPDVLEKLIVGGMDIVRLNFSHATDQQFYSIQKLIKEFNKKYDKRVELMLDLQGPRMRVGEYSPEGLKLIEGDEVILSTNPDVKDAIYIKDPYLHKDLEIDQAIFLSNGDIELFTTRKEGDIIKAKVVRGGILHSKKGVNLPDTQLTTGGLTEKDLRDIALGLANNVDYIAMSFVKDASDLVTLREKIKGSTIKIISKIERRQALVNIEEIIKESDVVMIARGDLGVEIPLEELPIIQKDIIRKCIEHQTPSIVATQMLASMVDHHRPTRAEVSDVANAVLDGAWGVMLSDETAFGKYPVQSLTYLVKTVQKAEEYLNR